MIGVNVRFDEPRGLLLGCVSAPLSDADLPELSRALLEAVAKARRHGPLRVLWTNRLGLPPGPAMSDLLHSIFVDQRAPEDRFAMVVADSMAKSRSRPRMATGQEIFASENAALTWLSVGTSAAA